jgi:hypothetical protein
MALSAGCAAWAKGCPPTPPISLYSDEPFDVQVFFDQKPAIATPLRIYALGKLVRSATADRSGRLRLGLLPEGEYRVIIPGKGMLDIAVLPEKSGLNGEMISWFLSSRSRYKWLTGRQIARNPCPFVMLKAD